MKKFSKLLESQGLLDQKIREIFIELIDLGFSLEMKTIQFHVSIKLECKAKIDPLEVIKDLLVCDSRMQELDLLYTESKYILLGGMFDDKTSRIELKYRPIESVSNPQDIKNWKDFSLYCENVLLVDGIYSPYFRIEVFGKHNWASKCPEGYDGFYIDYGQYSSDTPEQKAAKKKALIRTYGKKWQEFLEKYLEYEVDWNFIHQQGEWKTRADQTSPLTRPIPFNAEGIEVVKVLKEMTGG